MKKTETILKTLGMNLQSNLVEQDFSLVDENTKKGTFMFEVYSSRFKTLGQISKHLQSLGEINIKNKSSDEIELVFNSEFNITLFKENESIKMYVEDLSVKSLKMKI